MSRQTDERIGKYVRSERETEALVARDRRVVLAMRFDGAGVGRRAALALQEIRRRGYVIGWDSVVAFCSTVGVVAVEPTPDAIADYLILDGDAVPEPHREALLAQYAEEIRHGADFDEELPGDRRMRNLSYWGMLNRAMRDKLERGECVDLSQCERTEAGCYIVPPNVYQDGVDYCDAVLEGWMLSIGRSKIDPSRILAARDARFYQNDGFVCLWLR